MYRRSNGFCIICKRNGTFESGPCTRYLLGQLADGKVLLRVALAPDISLVSVPVCIAGMGNACWPSGQTHASERPFMLCMSLNVKWRCGAEADQDAKAVIKTELEQEGERE